MEEKHLYEINRHATAHFDSLMCLNYQKNYYYSPKISLQYFAAIFQRRKVSLLQRSFPRNLSRCTRGLRMRTVNEERTCSPLLRHLESLRVANGVSALHAARCSSQRLA